MHVTAFVKSESNHVEQILIGDKDNAKKVLEAVADKFGIHDTEELQLFREDDDWPISSQNIVKLEDAEDAIILHLSRCRHIKVVIHYQATTFQHDFGPGVTISKITKWVTDKGLELSKEEAAEHVLQFTASVDQPAPDEHIGSLASCPDCTIEFDLVRKLLVQG